MVPVTTNQITSFIMIICGKDHIILDISRYTNIKTNFASPNESSSPPSFWAIATVLVHTCVVNPELDHFSQTSGAEVQWSDSKFIWFLSTFHCTIWQYDPYCGSVFIYQGIWSFKAYIYNNWCPSFHCFSPVRLVFWGYPQNTAIADTRLVVDLPLWKIWLRQLGWWNSQYNIHVPKHHSRYRMGPPR